TFRLMRLRRELPVNPAGSVPRRTARAPIRHRETSLDRLTPAAAPRLKAKSYRSRRSLVGLALCLLVGAQVARAQLLTALFPEGVPGYGSEAGVTVKSRARPAFDPLGMRVD